jgi:hypothetical protein
LSNQPEIRSDPIGTDLQILVLTRFSSREPVSTSLENALEADDEGAHGQKKYQAAGHDGEE